MRLRDSKSKDNNKPKLFILKFFHSGKELDEHRYFTCLKHNNGIKIFHQSDGLIPLKNRDLSFYKNLEFLKVFVLFFY